MRDHSKHIQLTCEQAVEAILGACDFHPGVEEVALEESYGRVLAADATAQLDMPNCLTCMMDSIAVRWDDFAAAQEAGAGEGAGAIPDTSAWVRGVQWEFANTGVGMPEGFDTAIVVEHAEISADESHVTFDAAPSGRFAGTVPAGSRMHAGDVLVPAGTRITPLLAAHIASGNNTTVQVVARPRVAFIPTGNELVRAGGEIPRGRNIESNGLLMRGKILEWGGVPLIWDIVRDDPQAIEEALRAAAAEADIVVLNAGSSKGSDDWSLEVLERIGRVLYHQTNHGPGHHSSCSVLDGVPVIGISGPPGGAAFTTDFYLKPAMQAWFGETPGPVRVRVRMACSLPAFRHKPAVLAGEQRPSEGGTFFSVKQLILSIGEDGVLQAEPVPGGRPGPLAAERAHAYYLMDGDNPPAESDFVEVALRPE